MCSRQLWLLSALSGFSLDIVHKAGVELVLADALSRALSDHKAALIACEQCTYLGLVRVHVTHSFAMFDNDL